MTHEFMKVHGFTPLDETNGTRSDEFILDVNSVLPGTLFLVYDASRDNPGYYVVEYKELSDYNEA